MAAKTAAAATTGEKPSVLIIGGLGYTGRHLTKYLHENNLASQIRIVDKQLPELSWLAPEFKEACSRERFMQADAAQERSLPRIFDRENGQEFDYVFNCGGETRFSQEEKVYELRSHGLSLSIGREAAKRKIKCFVELSTGMVYKSDSSPRKESDKLKPWNNKAKWKLKAEEDLAKIEGLNLLIFRLPNIYGPYTKSFMSTMLCMARVYQSKKKEMRYLWKDDLRTNTVHIEDLVRALWHGAEWYQKGPAARRPAPTFNIVDHGNTSQKQTSVIMQDIFGIETGFHGTLISAFARLNLDHVVDEVNDETLDPWAELQRKAGINQSTPLSPFMEKELIRDADLSMDGAAFEKETGFTYKHEKLTKAGVEEIIESYKKMNWWP